MYVIISFYLLQLNIICNVCIFILSFYSKYSKRQKYTMGYVNRYLANKVYCRTTMSLLNESEVS